MPPAQRATEQRVKQYAAFLLDRVQPSSASSALGHLRLALRAITPEVSWAWMRPIQRRLDFRTVARDKREKMVHASVLIQLGESLIEKSQIQGEVHDPLAFRDGLIIMFLASRPIRRKNLAALTLDGHVADLRDRITITIEGNDTKNGRPIELQVPDFMVTLFRRYLYEVRPLIPGSSRHAGIWASPKGGPLTADGIYQMITRRTHAELGLAIHPHLFRDIAATTFALERPDDVRLTKDLLNHASFATTDKFYLQAQSMVAGRRHAAVVQVIRARLQVRSGKYASLERPSSNDWLTSTST